MSIEIENSTLEGLQKSKKYAIEVKALKEESIDFLLGKIEDYKKQIEALNAEIQEIDKAIELIKTNVN